ncbi:GDYXXLXY domain-containing protein [Advenella kashmirensis]
MQAPTAHSAQSGHDQIFRWRLFFNMGLRVLGIGLLASGIVTWIAANWDGLGKFERIAGVQLLLVAVVAVALVQAWRGRRSSGHTPGVPDLAHAGRQGVPSFAGALFLACVVTGGLLALLGQTYQTGADPWTLFGWWALLAVPWLLVARSWFVIVLWLVVLNTAIILLLGTQLLLSPQRYTPMGYAWVVAAINAGLLVGAERLRGHYGDPYRVVPRLLVLIILIALFCTLAASVESLFDGESDQAMLLQAVLVGAVVSGGFYLYRRVWPDFFILSQLAVFTVLYAGTYVLISSWLFAESIELSVALAFMVALGGMLGCVSWLRKVYQAQSDVPDRPAPSGHSAALPAAVTATDTATNASANAVEAEPVVTPARSSPLLFLFSFGFIFLLGLALIAVLEIPLTGAAGAALVAGLLAYFAAGGKWRVSGVTLMLVGLLLLAFEVFSGTSIDYTERALPILGLIAGLLILYHMYQIPWFQFQCAVAALVLFAILWPQYSPGFAFDRADASLSGYRHDADWLSFMSELAPVYIVLATVILMGLPQAWLRRYKTLAWALLCVPLGAYVIDMSALSYSSNQSVPEGQNMLAMVLSKWVLPTRFPMVYVCNLVFSLLPVGVAWLSATRRRVCAADQAVVLLVLLALGVLWGDLPGVQLGLLLCVLGYELHYRSMLVVGVISIIVFLAQFYFQVHFLLLDKAYFLIAQGAVLLVIALLWYWLRPVAAMNSLPADHNGTPDPIVGTSAGRDGSRLPASQARASRGWPRAPVLASIVTGLVAVLAAANVDIVQKEAIIRDGTRFVVALRPVDPRSLMQGDYMTLNFASQGGEDGNLFADYSHRYVELQPDAQGVYHFTRTLRQMAPPAQPGNVVVRYRRQLDERVLFVTDAYFFPEGQAEHFARARYGEFRVNQEGVALLTGLLDEKQNRL